MIILKHIQQISFNCPPGPAILPAYYIINFFKCLTLPFCLFLIYHFNNHSIQTYVYAAVHGSYGIIWYLKHLVFPDPNWNNKQTFLSMLMTILVLSAYWYMPYELISGQTNLASNIQIALCVLVYSIGLVLMMVSDAQKYYTLLYKKGLISNGMFYYTRNPNYLGEIMIYGSFYGLSQGNIGKYVILFMQGFFFQLNMRIKDHCSLRLKEGWQEYEKRSGLLLPQIPGGFIVNSLIYGLLFGIGWKLWYL